MSIGCWLFDCALRRRLLRRTAASRRSRPTMQAARSLRFVFMGLDWLVSAVAGVPETVNLACDRRLTGQLPLRCLSRCSKQSGRRVWCVTPLRWTGPQRHRVFQAASAGRGESRRCNSWLRVSRKRLVAADGTGFFALASSNFLRMASAPSTE